MTDYRIRNLARILVNYCTSVKENDLVVIRGFPFSFEAAPIFREVLREVLHADGHPHFYLSPDDFEEIDVVFFSEANDIQLQYVDPVYELLMTKMDCDILIMGSSNTHRLSGIDPSKRRMFEKAYTAIRKKRIQRMEEGTYRWVCTLFPTSGFAQDADMSLEEFEDFVFSTTFADAEAPVSEWNTFHQFQERIVVGLREKKQMEVKGPNVDLSLSIEDRSFINCDGRLNMPDGEIYTSPVEESVNGWIRFTYPAIFRGVEVDGVFLQFEQGRVVEATAEKNERFLHEMINMDEGAHYLGEFAIGTNKRINRFTRNILFDEKIGGTIHVALGYSPPFAGGKNESGIHWDMICDMREGGQILADGECIYESGKFLL